MVNRHLGPFVVQRHAFQRFSTRRRIHPEHVLVTLASELMPLAGLAVAQMMAAGRLRASEGQRSLILPLADGLAFGNALNAVVDVPYRMPAWTNAEPSRFGFTYLTAQHGLHVMPLGPHPVTHVPDTSRIATLLVRTVVTDDMLHDDQERAWHALQSFQIRHADQLNALNSVVWHFDIIERNRVEDWRQTRIAPENHRELLDAMADLMLSPDVKPLLDWS